MGVLTRGRDLVAVGMDMDMDMGIGMEMGMRMGDAAASSWESQMSLAWVSIESTTIPYSLAR